VVEEDEWGRHKGKKDDRRRGIFGLYFFMALEEEKLRRLVLVVIGEYWTYF